MPKKCCFSCFSLKSANRSGAFFDFCVCVPKIVQSYFPSQSFSPKIVQSQNRSVAQSFNHLYIHIVEMGYFAAHGTMWHRVLYCTRYCVVQGTTWRRVGNFSLCLLGPLGPSGTFCKNSTQIYIKKQLKQIKRKKNKKILKYICILNIYILPLHKQREKNAV